MAKELRKVTLGTTYFNNPTGLEKFIHHHQHHCDELIIVDDGSTVYPAIDVVRNLSDTSKIKIFKVKKDLGFNSHGCRNLIMTVAENDWVCLIDSDRLLIEPDYAFNVFRTRKLRDNCRYRFVAHVASRHVHFLGNDIHGSVNDFLINKNHFFSVGGYDEELVGIRNGDRQFFEQLLKTGTEDILLDVNLLLCRAPTNTLRNPLLNPSTPNIPRHLFILIKKRIETPDPNKPILQFDWERVF